MSKPAFREISTFRMHRPGQKKAETNLGAFGWRSALCGPECECGEGPRNAGFSHVENANALFQPRPPPGAEAPGWIVTAAFACEWPLVPIPTPTSPLPQHSS